MICFGPGEIDWEAISAVGTVSASFIALFASWLAIRAPEWARAAERKEATDEVVFATREALSLYEFARSLTAPEMGWPTEAVLPMRIKAGHLTVTLDRLISRPSLSDGAIATGAGALNIMEVLASLQTVEETRRDAIARAPAGIEGRIARYAGSRLQVLPIMEGLESAAEIVRARMEGLERHRKPRRMFEIFYRHTERGT